jgi:ATP-dependent DNA ligase
MSAEPTQYVSSIVVRAVNPSALRPMQLLRIPEPFDHPDWLYEVKFDGFRALAHVTAFDCKSFVCTARRSTRPRMMQ